MFIQTEATSDPGTVKFLPGKPVMPSGTAEFTDIDSSAASPLARRLFAIDGVARVALDADAITVAISDAEDWQVLKPAILGAIMEHYMSGAAIVEDAEGATDTKEQDEFFEPEDGDTVDTIKELLETRVRPAVAQDGGDITFQGYRDGIVYLTMRGACAGCPSSTATLQQGIENLLKHFIPEVQGVRPM